MKDKYRYGIIGTGIPWKEENATGFGMANPHYLGYKRSGRTDLVSIADTRADHAELFLKRHDEAAVVYGSYREMIAKENLDIVSICTWPHLHAEMAIAACEAGVPAIHCEKPMALNWGDCKRIKAAADASGSTLIFNHQRRYLEPFQTARRLIQEGAIGTIERMEAHCGDMSDWGTHWLDMMFYFNSETPAAWVIGQIDSREELRTFGAWTEGQAVCHFRFQNGVRAMLVTGFEASIGAAIRVIGSEGTIEVLWESPWLRVRSQSDAGWVEYPSEEGIHSFVGIDRACMDLIRALDEPGYRPLLTVDHTIQHTEVIYALFESSRKRGRVDLPLMRDDSALAAMVEAGEIGFEA